jgi:hypothetical protein
MECYTLYPRGFRFKLGEHAVVCNLIEDSRGEGRDFESPTPTFPLDYGNTTILKIMQ